jgi:hypothetical protein
VPGVKSPVRRPVGVTLTSLALAYLGAVGVAGSLLLPNAIGAAVAPQIMRASVAITSWSLSGLTLLYGLTALLASVGLWRMMPWGRQAFAAWVVVALTFMLAFVALIESPPDTPAILALASAAFFVTIFYAWWSYIRRVYDRAET